MINGLRSRPWAGLDLGSYSVKLIAHQGGRRGGHYWLAETPLPSAAKTPEGSPSPEVVSQAIAECMTQAGLSPHSLRGLSVGVSGPDVIIKQISLPLLAEEEVGSAIRLEARKHLPFDPQGMVIDHQILNRSTSERRLDVLLAAVSEQNLERRLTPLHGLGIEIGIVDATPLALGNALVRGLHASDEPHILLDIGHTSSHLILHQRKEPFFTRRIEFGGLVLARALAQTRSVSIEHAETLICSTGSNGSGALDWDAPEMEAVVECLRRDLVEELRRSLAFYRTLGHLPEPFKLWISGGSARLPGMAARLSEWLDTPVLVFNPLEALTGSPRSGSRPAPGPQFAQAFGLALRTA